MNDAERPQILANRRGVVVGVSGENSIGFHTSCVLRALGAQVAVTYRPARAGTCGPLAEGRGFLHAPLEATDEDSVARAFEGFGARLERFDFVVHTLMHVPEGALEKPLVATSAAEFHHVMEVGARSLLVVAKHAGPHWERSRAPRLVAVGSVCGERMTPHYHLAGIAKAALRATALYLAQELGPKGVLVNVVSPSMLATDGARAVVGEAVALATAQHLARKAPTRTAVQLDDAARAIAFFCSEFASNVTAAELPVDGGFSRLYL